MYPQQFRVLVPTTLCRHFRLQVLVLMYLTVIYVNVDLFLSEGNNSLRTVEDGGFGEQKPCCMLPHTKTTGLSSSLTRIFQQRLPTMLGDSNGFKLKQ